MKKLKIATFVASEVPFPLPKDFKEIYAPIDVALNIAEGLAQRGHHVFFFGPKGSRSKFCRTIEVPITPLYKERLLKDARTAKEMEKFFYLADQYIIAQIFRQNLIRPFDIIHIHPIDRSLGFALLTKTPIVYTLHDPITPWRYKMFDLYRSKNQFFISISNAQRKSAPNLNWIATIYNGIDIKKFHFSSTHKNYLLFAGRLLEKKGVHWAIRTAIKLKERLIIVGDKPDEKFFKKEVSPFLKYENIIYRGFVPFHRLLRFYRYAKALLCPIMWEEPFGLTFIEAQASGTPVVVFDRGSAREVVKDGKTGFVVKPFYNGKINLEGFIRAVGKIDSIKRIECRKWVEKMFTTEKMVENYEKTFYKIKEMTKN